MVEAIRSRTWLTVSLLTLLWHMLLFLVPWDRLLLSTQTLLPPRVEINQVDPETLAKIRQRWKKKNLLLNRLNQQESKTAPKDARYFSDKNIRVEEEQRARARQVIPKPGNAGPDIQAQQPSTAGGQKATSPVRPATPKLSALGVPLKLNRQAKLSPNPAEQSRAAIRPNRAGGDQAIDDPTLKEGSENLLNSEQSVYYSYYARLYESIGPLWQSNIKQAPIQKRLLPGSYVTQVDVVFDREGELLDIHYLKRSGVPGFDDAVERSWRKISRFPNPPKALLNKKGQVHTGWTFTVELKQGLQVYSPPPTRNY